MGSLYHTLGIGAQSLYANRQGVDTAGHNISNAQTEGFSRQRVNLTQRDPSDSGGIIIGNGSYAESITRTHDSFLEKQLNYAVQTSGRSNSMSEGLEGIEQIFSPEMQNSVTDELTKFFNSLQDLSSYPEEMPIRTSVREAAQSAVNAFHRVDAALRQNQSFMDDKLEGMAIEVNGMLNEIASLNTAILSLEAGREGQANDLRDQQDRLVRTLSEKMDIDYYKNETGNLVIRGPDQTLLVDRGYAARVSTQPDPDTGHLNVVAYDPSSEAKAPREITSVFEAGAMKATIDIRDRIIPNLIEKNNEMAIAFASSFNEIHRQGYGLGDFSETVGRDFFELGTSDDRAAQDIAVSAAIIEDVNAISAAATPNAPGDNVVLNQLLSVRSKPILEGGNMTMNQYYADYVGQVGLEIERSHQERDADGVLLGDLSKRRESISGVSVDEEAVNLLRWQTAFAASSKVITTADEMLETILSLKR